MKNTELIKGTLSTILLQLLSEEDRLYGYEIAQRVRQRTEEKILIKEGSLYPALHKLEEQGLLQSETEYAGKRPRRYYRLTDSGKKEAKASLAELREFIRTLEQLLQPYPPEYGPA